MTRVLTQEFENRLKKAGADKQLTPDEVLKRAMKLYELASGAERVEIVTNGVRQEVRV